MILIQDLHIHPPVQKKIRDLLGYLFQQPELIDTRLIGVEGAEGPLPTMAEAARPNPALKRRVADFLIDQGELTGAEAFAIEAGRGNLLWGVENDKFYQADRSLYVMTMQARRDLRQRLEFLDARLSEVAKRFKQPPAVLAVDRMEKALNAGAIEPGDVLKEWLKVGADLPLAMGPYPHLQALAHAIQTQSNALSQEDIRQFNSLFDVTEELEAFAPEFKAFLVTDRRSQNAFLAQKSLRFLIRYLSQQATPYEVMDWTRRLQEMIARVKALGILSDQEVQELIHRISNQIDFYSLALARNEPMAMNLLTELNRRAQLPAPRPQFPASRLLPLSFVTRHRLDPGRSALSTAVLVAGGFHTRGITEILRKQGVSYLVIAPAIEEDLKPEYSALYEERLADHHLSADQIESGVRKTLGVPEPAEGEVRQGRPSALAAYMGMRALVRAAVDHLAFVTGERINADESSVHPKDLIKSPRITIARPLMSSHGSTWTEVALLITLGAGVVALTSGYPMTGAALFAVTGLIAAALWIHDLWTKRASQKREAQEIIRSFNERVRQAKGSSEPPATPGSEGPSGPGQRPGRRSDKPSDMESVLQKVEDTANRAHTVEGKFEFSNAERNTIESYALGLMDLESASQVAKRLRQTMFRRYLVLARVFYEDPGIARRHPASTNGILEYMKSIDEGTPYKRTSGGIGWSEADDNILRRVKELYATGGPVGRPRERGSTTLSELAPMIGVIGGGLVAISVGCLWLWHLLAAGTTPTPEAVILAGAIAVGGFGLVAIAILTTLLVGVRQKKGSSKPPAAGQPPTTPGRGDRNPQRGLTWSDVLIRSAVTGSLLFGLGSLFIGKVPLVLSVISLVVGGSLLAMAIQIHHAERERARQSGQSSGPPDKDGTNAPKIAGSEGLPVTGGEFLANIKRLYAPSGKSISSEKGYYDFYEIRVEGLSAARLSKSERAIWNRLVDDFHEVFKRSAIGQTGDGRTFKSSFRLFEARYNTTVAAVPYENGMTVFYVNRKFIENLARLKKMMGDEDFLSWGPLRSLLSDVPETNLIDSIFYAVAFHEMAHHWGADLNKWRDARAFVLHLLGRARERELQPLRGGKTYNALNMAAYKFYLKLAGISTEEIERAIKSEETRDTINRIADLLESYLTLKASGDETALIGHRAVIDQATPSMVMLKDEDGTLEEYSFVDAVMGALNNLLEPVEPTRWLNHRLQAASALFRAAQDRRKFIPETFLPLLKSHLLVDEKGAIPPRIARIARLALVPDSDGNLQLMDPIEKRPRALAGSEGGGRTLRPREGHNPQRREWPIKVLVFLAGAGSAGYGVYGLWSASQIPELNWAQILGFGSAAIAGILIAGIAVSSLFMILQTEPTDGFNGKKTDGSEEPPAATTPSEAVNLSDARQTPWPTPNLADLQRQIRVSEERLDNGEWLPLRGTGTRELEDAWAARGVKLGPVVEEDPLFRHVIVMPKDWKVAQVYEDATRRNLVDGSGNVRAVIFYKTAIYDRRAFVELKYETDDPTGGGGIIQTLTTKDEIGNPTDEGSSGPTVAPSEGETLKGGATSSTPTTSWISRLVASVIAAVRFVAAFFKRQWQALKIFISKKRTDSAIIEKLKPGLLNPPRLDDARLPEEPDDLRTATRGNSDTLREASVQRRGLLEMARQA